MVNCHMQLTQYITRLCGTCAQKNLSLSTRSAAHQQLTCHLKKLNEGLSGVCHNAAVSGINTHTDICMGWMGHWGSSFPSKRVKDWERRHDLNEGWSHVTPKLTQGNEDNSQHKRPIVTPLRHPLYPSSEDLQQRLRETQWYQKPWAKGW